MISVFNNAVRKHLSRCLCGKRTGLCRRTGRTGQTGPRQTLLFTLTFAVCARVMEALADSLQSVSFSALLILSAVWRDHLLIQRKEQSRHELIRQPDSGQIEALDRDYVKASSVCRSAPQTSIHGLSLLNQFSQKYSYKVM